MPSTPDAADFDAVLFGVALGDALGLPYENIRPRAAARVKLPPLSRAGLLPGYALVSDDTELSALAGQSLVRAAGDPVASARAFARSLGGWFLRLPWGLGLATLRASVRALLGFARTGVRSAGNGAAMRAAVVGLYAASRTPTERAALSDALAEVTHTDPRAVQGARFVAELTARLWRLRRGEEESFDGSVRASLEVVQESSLRAALERAWSLSESCDDSAEASKELGCTGFVLHSVPLALWALCRAWREGDAPEGALHRAVRAGGDTDTHAALVGGWAGAWKGPSAWSAESTVRLCPGPFGEAHLRALSAALERSARGEAATAPRYSVLAALARNLALYPVILVAGVRTLLR